MYLTGSKMMREAATIYGQVMKIMEENGVRIRQGPGIMQGNMLGGMGFGMYF